MISKYPPIEGGEASKVYWLSKALGSRGHEIHIVTNALEVEEEYREGLSSDDLAHYQPFNVTVHNTDPFFNPWYIPYSKPFTEKIASSAIEIIREFKTQLIDSWYILPYGVSGFIAKTFTQKPQILRHAGSDIFRLMTSPYLSTLFIELIRNVDKVVTYPSLKTKFMELGVSEKKIFINSYTCVDTNAFNPNVIPLDLSIFRNKKIKEIPIITYIGKIGITKGVFELIEALSYVNEDFVLLLVTSGRWKKELKETVAKFGLIKKTIYMDFVPPWRIPSIIKASTCVVDPEREFQIQQHSPILPREVLAVGTCLMLSKELYEKLYSVILHDHENVLIVEPKDIIGFSIKLKEIIKNPELAEKIGSEGVIVSKKIEDFNHYVERMEELYKDVLSNKS